MKTILGVKGMKCNVCETTVREAVQSCEGVISVEPSFKENKVEIEYEEGKANLDAIRQVIIDKGFQVV